MLYPLHYGDFFISCNVCKYSSTFHSNKNDKSKYAMKLMQKKIQWSTMEVLKHFSDKSLDYFYSFIMSHISRTINCTREKTPSILCLPIIHTASSLIEGHKEHRQQMRRFDWWRLVSSYHVYHSRWKPFDDGNCWNIKGFEVGSVHVASLSFTKTLRYIEDASQVYLSNCRSVLCGSPGETGHLLFEKLLTFFINHLSRM